MERSSDLAPQPKALAASPLSLALVAGLCWAVAIWLMLVGDLRIYESFFAPLRIIFYMAVLLASALTFIPVERRLELPGLAAQGIGGSLLLTYTLALVPPPTGWLLALPDTPVYLLLIASLFWLVSAMAMPLMYTAGLYLWSNRARQLDLRRVRRQGHEAGMLVALVAVLASLRVLTWVSLLLLVLILLIGELLFLSRIEPQT